MQTVQSRLDRIALALREQRLELGVSQRQLAALSGVSRDTIVKLERGGQVSPKLLLGIAAVLTLLEVYSPPQPEPVAFAAGENGNTITLGEIEQRLVEMAS